MGDHADYLIEQGLDELIRHNARQCETEWCQYCRGLRNPSSACSSVGVTTQEASLLLCYPSTTMTRRALTGS